jgi:hypothetical protein
MLPGACLVNGLLVSFLVIVAACMASLLHFSVATIHRSFFGIVQVIMGQSAIISLL